MIKVSVKDIKQRKGKSKITMLTAYDYSFAGIFDAAGIDIILVGDSLANVVLGMKETRNLSLSEMSNHTRAVARAVRRALVVADMPYSSYQKNSANYIDYAVKLMVLGAGAVKVEWFSLPNGKDCSSVVRQLVKNKIPVMGHIGLTPQTAHLLGGYKVQGRDKESAAKLIRQAKALESAGAFSLVLECIPYLLSRQITAGLKIPTIGIGAGKYCDGQVLVSYDFLGLYKEIKPKFVRVYKDIGREVETAVALFIKDVKKGRFPDRLESFTAGRKRL